MAQIEFPNCPSLGVYLPAARVWQRVSGEPKQCLGPFALWLQGIANKLSDWLYKCTNGEATVKELNEFQERYDDVAANYVVLDKLGFIKHFEEADAADKSVTKPAESEEHAEQTGKEEIKELTEDASPTAKHESHSEKLVDDADEAFTQDTVSGRLPGEVKHDTSSEPSKPKKRVTMPSATQVKEWLGEVGFYSGVISNFVYPCCERCPTAKR